MVQMLINQHPPLRRRQPPKKRMRIPRTPSRPRPGKPLNRLHQPLPLHQKLKRPRRKQLRHRRRIPSKRFIIPQHQRLDQRAHQPPRQTGPFPLNRTHSHLNPGPAMRQSLCHLHPAPQSSTIRPQPKHPLLQLRHHPTLKHIFHEASMPQSRITRCPILRPAFGFWREGWERKSIAHSVLDSSATQTPVRYSGSLQSDSGQGL
jgi:hypothetical protein